MPSAEDLDALVDTGRAAKEEPRWHGYAEYCRLRAHGLRAQALQALDAFVTDAASWLLPERIVFAKWAARAADHERYSPALPEPLVRRLLIPVAVEQVGHDPTDAEAHLLLAALSDPAASPDRYRSALVLDPTNAMISRVFVRTVLRWADDAQHEMPRGYLGDPREDAELLERAIEAVNTARIDVSLRAPLEQRLALARAAMANGTPRAE
jgi:hypothetical protein